MKYAKITRNLPGLLVILLLFTITACKPQEGELPFKAIAQDDGGLDYVKEEPNLLIIAESEKVATPELDIQFPSELADELRTLDYDRFFAILVLQGLKHQGGYSVTVQQINRQDAQVNVQAEFVSPAPGTRRTQAFTSPYHLVAISKKGAWGQQIRFVLMVDGEPVAETIHFIP